MLYKGKQTMSFLQYSTSLPKFPKHTLPVPQQSQTVLGAPAWPVWAGPCGMEQEVILRAPPAWGPALPSLHFLDCFFAYEMK